MIELSKEEYVRVLPLLTNPEYKEVQLFGSTVT
jgi:hypothetical protein